MGLAFYIWARSSHRERAFTGVALRDAQVTGEPLSCSALTFAIATSLNRVLRRPLKTAQYSCVPAYKRLTNEFHPTQILADFLTMQEHVEKPLHRVAHAFAGDAGNNMGDSLLIGADALLLLADVWAVYDGFGTGAATPIRAARATCRKGRSGQSWPRPAISPIMGGAGIGRLADSLSILGGMAGTRMSQES